MKYLILALVMGPLLADAEIRHRPKIFYDLNEAKDIFDKFIVQFNKKYEDDEYETRLEIFKENLEKINEYNRESNMTVFGINHLSDLKYEEFVNSYLGFKDDFSHRDVREYRPSLRSAPDRLDYRESGLVTAVKNQGFCNDCYIFSAIGAIEGQHAKTHGTLVSLSEQQGLDCDEQARCEKGGFPTHTMEVLAQQGGSMSSEDYPYEGRKAECRLDENKMVVKVTGGYQLSVNDEDDLKLALAEHGPLSIGLTVCEKFKHYSGSGLFQYNCTGIHKHALVLVGYDRKSDTGIPYWIIKNSWDTVWGDEGYVYLEMGKKMCSIGDYVVVATVA